MQRNGTTGRDIAGTNGTNGAFGEAGHARPPLRGAAMSRPRPIVQELTVSNSGRWVNQAEHLWR
jgi:hypothetical protein